MKALICRYPDFLQGSQEFTEIQNAMDPSASAAWTARDGLAAQLCVDTATWGLQYWEKSLGIPVEVNKDLNYRRSRVRSKLRGAGATTVALIRNVAESYSNGDVDVIEHPAQYSIDIKFVGTIGIPPNLDDLTASLREIMPAHIAWDYIIIYNTWDAVSSHTWAELATHTWAEVKESDLNA